MLGGGALCSGVRILFRENDQAVSLNVQTHLCTYARIQYAPCSIPWPEPACCCCVVGRRPPPCNCCNCLENEAQHGPVSNALPRGAVPAARKVVRRHQEQGERSGNWIKHQRLPQVAGPVQRVVFSCMRSFILLILVVENPCHVVYTHANRHISQGAC